MYLAVQDVLSVSDPKPAVEIRIDIFRGFLEGKVKSRWPDAKISNTINNAVQEDSLKRVSKTKEDKNNGGPIPDCAKGKSSPCDTVLIGAIVKAERIEGEELAQMCRTIGILPLSMHHKDVWRRNEESLLLKDHTAQIELILPNDRIIPAQIVSGVVCAIKGSLVQKCFLVEDVVYPTPASPEWPVTKSNYADMVFISGLHIGKMADDFAHRHLLMEYLQGIGRSPAAQGKTVRKNRVFILGNIFPTHQEGRRKGLTNLASLVQNTKLIDDFLSQLSETMEVYLLPGENEPTCAPFLPQPPVHSKMLPISSKKSKFHRLCNPASVKIPIIYPTDENSESLGSSSEGEMIHLILNSGQNISDALKCCEIKYPLKMAKKFLEWSHIHPTRRNNIQLCGGSCSEEVFSLKGVLPHLFVMGNQKSFGVEVWNGVKIISVPDFESTGIIALLNRDLEVLPMSFKILFN